MWNNGTAPYMHVVGGVAVPVVQIVRAAVQQVVLRERRRPLEGPVVPDV